GTHDAGVELAAVTVVVAHLYSLGQTLRRVAAGSGRAFVAGHRIALDVPRRPVQLRLHRNPFVLRTEAEQRGIVHFWRRDDLAGIHAVVRVEQHLDRAERGVQARSELPGHPFAAAQAVAMLARIRTLVFAHHRRGFFGDRAHLGRTVATHVEDRPDVQGADTGMRVPGAAGAVFPEHFGQPVGVFGQMLERHRAVLDERDRLAVAFHRHHDVE